MGFSLEKAQAAFDRIHHLGGGGVWESDMVAITLDGVSITDDDLALFADFPVVEILSLADTPITDAGLIHLQKLHRLETLSLVGTNVTDDGVEKLRTALPNAEISTELPPKSAANPFNGEPLEG